MFWVAYRKINEPDYIEIEGPYSTRDQAKAKRKELIPEVSPHCEVCNRPFLAASRDEAEEKAMQQKDLWP